MASLDLIPAEFEHEETLSSLIPVIEKITNLNVITRKINHDLKVYFDPGRSQYDAARILHQFENYSEGKKTIIITSVDLFIPIFTFVFGLASLGGNVAIVSSNRLKNQYYGLPEDNRKLSERLLKEIIHELGHLYNLKHCKNYRCVMASSHTVDDLDIKGARFCSQCEANMIRLP